MKRNYIIIIALLLSLYIGGCAASFEFGTRQPLKAKLGEYKTLVLKVESSVTENIDKELNDLRGLTVSQIMSLNAFKNVQLAGSTDNYGEGTLLVRMVIADINKVSASERFWLGAFAGQASMQIDVTLVDAASKKLLGSYAAKGSSGGTGYSGGTADAVEQTVTAVVEIIKSHL